MGKGRVGTRLNDQDDPGSKKPPQMAQLEKDPVLLFGKKEGRS
jgi:hypothetical protein